MADRHAKYQRLEAFRRRLPHVTASALSAIIQDIDKHGLPGLSNRRDMMNARNVLANSMTPYGPIQQTLMLRGVNAANPAVPLLVNNPLAMLWQTCHSCAGFGKLLKRTHAATPSTQEQPWNLLLYSDEIVPGNPMAPTPTRKIQTIYFSFMEFGSIVLCKEEAWFCVTDKRSKSITEFAGGMSQVFGAILKLFFPSSGSSLADCGITLKHGDDPLIRLFVKLCAFIQDGGAHKFTWHVRGDAGTKMFHVQKPGCRT